jgi:hypothetical protein
VKVLKDDIGLENWLMESINDNNKRLCKESQIQIVDSIIELSLSGFRFGCMLCMRLLYNENTSN